MTNILFCSAILVEAIGIPVCLFQEHPPVPWAVLLANHAVVSGAIGYLGNACLPNHVQAPRWSIVGLFAGLTLFIPVMGAIGVLIMVVLSHRLSRSSNQDHIQRLGQWASHRTKQSHLIFKKSDADFHGRLTSSSVPAHARLETLGKLQTFGNRHTTRLFRHALHDEVEDIRLVAFGILDKKEQAIQARINQELELYQRCTDSRQQAEHARVLASALWELVYEDLVHGDVALHVLSQARHYAHCALRVNEQDAGLWALLGQIALRLEHWDEARNAFLSARHHGIAESRVTPYLAELAFREKDFISVRASFTDTTLLDDAPLLHPIVAYWRGTSGFSPDPWSSFTLAQGRSA